MISGYLIAIGILSFLMSFAIGANDAANALATSYGSNALRLRYLVLLGAICEFIGAFFCSGHVAGHLVGNIIEEAEDLELEAIQSMMLGTSVSAFIFIITSSLFGIPISGTHTIVGAIIGAGLAVVSASSINWVQLAIIAASWFIAPILAILLCALFFAAVVAGTLDQARYSFQMRLLWLTLISGCAFMLICVMIIGLIREKDSPWTTTQLIFLLLSPIIGVIITRTILFFLMRHSEKVDEADQ